MGIIDPDPDLLLGQLPVYVLVNDPEGRLVWVNRPASSYGFRPEEILGKPPEEFHDRRTDLSGWYAAFRRALAGEVSPYALHCTTPAPPGWADFLGRVGPLAGGGAVTVCWDVTRPGGAPPPAEPGGAELLSPLGREVVRVLLRASGPLKGAAVGAAVGEARGGRASTRLKFLLADLVERHILAHGPDGYTVAEGFKAAALTLVNPGRPGSP